MTKLFNAFKLNFKLDVYREPRAEKTNNQAR